MSTRDRILQEVLTLPLEDQLFVVEQIEERFDHLIHSDVPEDQRFTAEEFAAEILRRSEAYKRGETTAMPWEEFMAEQRRRQACGE